MSDRLAIPSKELALGIVGPVNSLKLARVQRLTTDVNSNPTDVDELGNPGHAGTSTDIPEATLSFTAMDVGIKIFSVLTGTDWEAYPAEGVDISSLDEVDAILYVKSHTVADYVKTGHLQRLQIRDFTFSYSVDGDSTEEYSMVGSSKRWFKNDVQIDRFTTGTTSFTLSETPIQLKNGNDLLSVIVDGDYMTEVAAAPATGEYSISGTTLTTGDSRVSQVIVVYHANPAGNNWTDITDNDMPASIKGQDVKIVIGANNITRVQSVTINGNLNPEAVRELGNRQIVGYQKQVPTVEGTLTVLDTDTELIELLTVGTLNSGDTEFLIESSCAASGVSLEVKLIDPCDTTSPYTVVKTVYIPEITVTGDGYSSNVNGNATQTFNFRSVDADCWVFSGARA